MDERFSDEELELMGAAMDLAGSSELIALPGGAVMRRVHPPSVCAAQPWPCWVHTPGYAEPLTGSRMVHHGRGSNAVGYLCGHQVVHPCWADAAYQFQVHHRDLVWHECCGERCCTPIPESVLPWLPGPETGSALEEWL